MEDEYILKLCTEWQSCLVGCNGVALVIVLKYRKKAVLIRGRKCEFSVNKGGNTKVIDSRPF